MLGIIWFFIIILSCGYGVFSGNTAGIGEAFFSGAEGCVSFILKTGSIMVLWQGVLNVAHKSGISQSIAKLLGAPIAFLFREVKKGSKEAQLIANNITANILGLSNAATPSGMEAMKELSKKSKNLVATDDMCLFAVLNTASLQLIPSTLIAIRQSYGSQAPGEIIVPVWIASSLTVIFAIIMAKLFSKGGHK